MLEKLIKWIEKHCSPGFRLDVTLSIHHNTVLYVVTLVIRQKDHDLHYYIEDNYKERIKEILKSLGRWIS